MPRAEVGWPPAKLSAPRPMVRDAQAPLKSLKWLATPTPARPIHGHWTHGVNAQRNVAAAIVPAQCTVSMLQGFR